MKTIHRILVPAVVVVTVGLLAGCQGGAQTQNPVAKVPGSSESAQTKTSNCQHASRSTVAQLNGQLQTGTKVQLADIVKDGTVWYVAASTSGDERNSSGKVTVGIWGSVIDPTVAKYTGTLTPVNSQARSAETAPTAPASATPTASAAPFRATSAAAVKAQKCMIQDSGLYQ
jgi:hypothetical protein